MAIMAGKQSISTIKFLLGLFNGRQRQQIERQTGRRSQSLSSLFWTVFLALPSPTVIPASTKQTHLRFQLLRFDPSKLTLPLPFYLLPSDGEGCLLLLTSGGFIESYFGFSFFHNRCLQFLTITIPYITKVPVFCVLSTQDISAETLRDELYVSLQNLSYSRTRMAFDSFCPSYIKNLTHKRRKRGDGGWHKVKKDMNKVKDALIFIPRE